MSFPSLRNRFLTGLCVVLLGVTVVTATANAASLPFLGTRLYYTLGSVLFGGMIAAGSNSLGTTSVAGHVQVLPEFASATTLRTVTNSTSRAFPYLGTFTAYVRGTGSTTLRQSAACFKNPFQGMSGGSGIVLNLQYHVGNSPAGVGGDIGFVDNCTNHTANDNTASGDSLMNNVCTNTGCTSQYTTGTAGWNGARYIKFTPRANLTAGYTGRITGQVINVWGE